MLVNLLGRESPIWRVAKRTVDRFLLPLDLYRRMRVDRGLEEFSRRGKSSSISTVVYDATFDNPNHWVRCAILRCALGLTSAKQHALTGQYSVGSVKRMFKRWGNVEVHSLADAQIDRSKNLSEARSLLEVTKTAHDFLNWRFACGLPSTDVYDSVIKRQRRGTIDLSDPNLAAHIASILDTHDRASQLFDRIRPDLFVISHTASANTAYGAILWAALARGIETVIPWGAFGSMRLYRVRNWDDVYDWAGPPKRDDIESLSPEAASSLAEKGRAYIEKRMSGTLNDTSAEYAYRRPKKQTGRAEICKRFGWSEETPIVAVYASVWFDNPHVFGMTEFTDFDDWLRLSVRVAQNTSGINYLFKPHPSEQFYGGPKLCELMGQGAVAPNVAVSDTNWNGRTIVEAIDAIVTLHGTIGVEATACGVPVLAAGPGWYDHLNFVRRATTREEYARDLSRMWWIDFEPQKAAREAAIFAGWFYESSVAEHKLSFGEDHEGKKNLPLILNMLKFEQDELDAEAKDVEAWWLSNEKHFHTFRMRKKLSVR